MKGLLSMEFPTLFPTGIPMLKHPLLYEVSMQEYGSAKTKDEVSMLVGIGIEGVASLVVGEGSWRLGPGVVAW